MNIFRLILIITSVVAVTFNSVSMTNGLLLTLATILALIFTKRYPFHENYAKYLMFFCIWMSAIAMPAYHLAEPIIKHYEPITQYWLNKLLEFGVPLYLIVTIFLYISGILIKGKEYHTDITYVPQPIPQKTINNVIIGSIFLSLFCFSISLGRMGSEAVRLPFHLSGIINLFRNSMLPILFAVAVENFILRGKQMPKKSWLLFIVWCVVEIFAWLSKAVLVSHLQVALLLLYIYYRPPLKKVIRTLAPLAAAFLFMYPIIEGMRSHDRGESLLETFQSAKKEADENDEHNGLLTPLNRTFLYDAQYVQDYRYISDDIFDFSKFPLMVAWGGAAGFQTFAIDGYPPEAHHSSGTCGIMDPLLHGGRGFLYIVMFILSLFAAYIDKNIAKGYISIFAILFLMLYGFLSTSNVSRLYNSTGLQGIFVYLCCVYIAYKYNFKNKIQ